MVQKNNALKAQIDLGHFNAHFQWPVEKTLVALKNSSMATNRYSLHSLLIVLFHLDTMTKEKQS